MARYTNNARGPRVINVAGPNKDAPPVQLTLAPGETSDDVKIANADDPVLLGLIENRELSVDGPLKELSEEEQAEDNVRRLRNSPEERARLDGAHEAARTPGLVDTPVQEEGEEDDGQGGKRPRAKRSRG